MNRLRMLLGIVPGSPFRTFMLGFYLLMGLSLVVSSGLYLAGVDPIWALIVLLPIGMAPVVVPVVALISHSYLAGMRDLLAGRGWARWAYSPEEWQRFSEDEWARARWEVKRAPFYGLFLGAIIGGAYGLLSHSVLVGLGTGAIVVVAGLLYSAVTWLSGRWRYRGRDRTPGDVLVGRDGLFARGQYVAFRAFNLRLHRVELEAGDPAALLVVTESLTQYGARRQYETRVPVPHGREAEATAIVQRLRAQHDLS